MMAHFEQTTHLSRIYCCSRVCILTNPVAVLSRTAEAIQQKTTEQLSPLPTSNSAVISLSPFKTSQKSQKKTEPTLPELSLVPAMRNSDKVKGELFETSP